MSRNYNDDLLNLGMKAAKTETGQKIAKKAADHAAEQAKEQAKQQAKQQASDAKDDLLYDDSFFNKSILF